MLLDLLVIANYIKLKGGTPALSHSVGIPWILHCLGLCSVRDWMNFDTVVISVANGYAVT